MLTGSLRGVRVSPQTLLLYKLAEQRESDAQRDTESGLSTFKIAVLAGDYIGPEIIAEAVRVLEAAGRRFGHTFEFEEALAGGAAWDAHGEHLPQSTLAVCERADAILKGPFGGPRNEINHPKWQ